MSRKRPKNALANMPDSERLTVLAASASAWLVSQGTFRLEITVLARRVSAFGRH